MTACEREDAALGAVVAAAAVAVTGRVKRRCLDEGDDLGSVLEPGSQEEWWRGSPGGDTPVTASQ